MSKLDIKTMTTSHIINRIAWAKRQIIDPWDVHGYEPKYGAGGYTDAVLNEQNEEIEKHIEELEKELIAREAINSKVDKAIEKILSKMDRNSFRFGGLETYSLTRPIAIEELTTLVKAEKQALIKEILSALPDEEEIGVNTNAWNVQVGHFVTEDEVRKRFQILGYNQALEHTVATIKEIGKKL